MLLEKPAWTVLCFANEDVVCASGIDLPGQNVGGGVQKITTPGGAGGISGPSVPLP